jgi:hypothetical protein
MGLESLETPKANGLKTALDTIIAPKDAFEQLRVSPTWGWAFLITLVLYAGGTFLLTPALLHATQASWPQLVASNPALAQLTPEQQQSQLSFILKIVSFSWVFTIVLLPILLLIQTLIMTIFKAIGRGDASFGTLWAVATNITVPALGLAALCTAAVAMLRGPESFEKTIDVQTALPSLGLLMPDAPVKLHAFLSVFNPFSLWGCGLMGLAMIVTARVSKPIAWTTAGLILLSGAGLTALGAR